MNKQDREVENPYCINKTITKIPNKEADKNPDRIVILKKTIYYIKKEGIEKPRQEG